MRRKRTSITPPASQWEKLRSLEAIKAIQAGRIKVPLRCSHCRSESVRPSADLPALLECISCSRSTHIALARAIRRQEMSAIIVEGIDPRPDEKESDAKRRDQELRRDR